MRIRSPAFARVAAMTPAISSAERCFSTGDLTAPVLLTAHNVAFYLDFAARIREAIASAALPAFAREWTSRESV